MSNEPKDPFRDFGTGFRPAGERVLGEAEKRREMSQLALAYHHGFLDDILRALLPHDLVLLGAWSGVGKTAQATQIAMMNAEHGRRVGYIALEAEDAEIERRIKYQLLVRMARGAKAPGADEVTYADWYLNRCEDVLGRFNRDADRMIATKYAGLQTYYRGGSFTDEDLSRLVHAVQDQVDLVVLDHMHYVDVDDENENRGYKNLTKTIRHCSLSIGKPVLVVVHLRKKDRGRPTLVPTLDDIHGSSDIAKIATRVVMIAPAPSVEAPKWYLAPTFVSVPKDRVSGATPYVALCMFDRRFQSYEDNYTLGRSVGPFGDKWQAIKMVDRPRWARNHVDIETPPAADEVKP